MSSTENNQNSFSYVKKILAWVLIALVLTITLISFVILPALGPGKVTNDSEIDFGSWNKQPISFKEDTFFYNYVTQQIKIKETQKEQNGEVSKLSKKEYQSIFSDGYRSAILRLAALESTNQAGLIIPSTVLDKALVSVYTNPQTGKFSKELYNSIPAETKDLIRKDSKDQLAQTIYVQDNFGLKQSDAEKQLLLSMTTDKRNFSVVSFPMSDFPQDLYISYGTNNQQKFVKYDISLITEETETKAKELLQRIQSQELTFEDAAASASQAYSNETGIVISNYRFQLERFMNEEVLSLLNELPVGELSSVVQIGEQYGFLKVNGPARKPDLSNEQTIETVKSYVDTYEKALIQDHFTSIAKNFAEDAKLRGFNQAARKVGREVKSTGFITLNYGNTPLLGALNLEQDLSVFSYDTSLLKSAFALNKGEISEPIVSYNNVFVITLSDLQEEEVTEKLTRAYDQNIMQITNEDFSYSILMNDKHSYNFDSAFNQIVRE